MRFPRYVALASCVAALSGCPNFNEPVAHFSQAANNTQSAEGAFIRDAQRKECEAAIYESAFEVAIGHKPSSSFDFVDPCPAIVITQREIQIRDAAMAAIVLYANSLQALATGGSDTSLDADLKTTATNLSTASKANAFQGVSSSLSNASAVTQAIGAVADWVLELKVSGDIKEASKNMQENLKTLPLTIDPQQLME
jgi:hypothetical protein